MKPFAYGIFLGTTASALLTGAIMLRPSGQINIDLGPSDYAFLVNTGDNSLAASDFTAQTLGAGAVNGQTIFIPKVWQRVRPGWGPGTRTAVPSARLFIAQGVRQSVELKIELDTLDVVNVTVPMELTVLIQNQEDAARFITSVYGSLSDKEQEAASVRPDVVKYLKEGGGASRIKDAAQSVYGQVPLDQLDARKSGLVADAKLAVAKALAEVGLTVTELSTSDYVFNEMVTATLKERRDSLTERQAAEKEVDTAEQQSRAVAERNQAFKSPQEALRFRCVGLVRRYIDSVIDPAVNNGLFNGVESAPSTHVLGVPTPNKMYQMFGCNE